MRQHTYRAALPVGMTRHFIRHESGSFYNYLTGPHVISADDALSWPTFERAAETAAGLSKSAGRGSYAPVTLKFCRMCEGWRDPAQSCDCRDYSNT